MAEGFPTQVLVKNIIKEIESKAEAKRPEPEQNWKMAEVIWKEILGFIRDASVFPVDGGGQRQNGELKASEFWRKWKKLWESRHLKEKNSMTMARRT